jgi:hypothetical protein
MEMNQTKLESLFESVINVGSGFILAFIIWQTIAPIFLGYEITYAENFVLTSIFTVVSVARGYIWRRFFNAGIHKLVHNFVKQTYARFN